MRCYSNSDVGPGSDLPGDVLRLTVRLLPLALLVLAVGSTQTVAAPQLSGPSPQIVPNARLPQPIDPVIRQVQVRRLAAETKYAEAYYVHLQRMNEITEGKFVWQDRASNVTLWLVAFVVISGVGLSFFQIWIAFHKSPDATTNSSDTTIEASATSFRVTSSVVGIIVLIISTGFLYLFLKEVYDIKVIDITKATPTPTQQTYAVPLEGAGTQPLTIQQYGEPVPDAQPPSLSQITSSKAPSRQRH